jgi:hypothetical protein
MSPITLSTLSIVMGLVVALINLFGVVNPKGFAAAMRRFPRSLPWGYALMLLGTAVFVWFVKMEPISDFERLKPYLYTLFIAVGVGSCVFVKDFLAVRGFAIVILLLAKIMVDTARWHDSSWRWVISGWAYLLVVLGILYTVAPYRMRDMINWNTLTESRTRLYSAVRFAFGLFVALLGFVVFK